MPDRTYGVYGKVEVNAVTHLSASSPEEAMKAAIEENNWTLVDPSSNDILVEDIEATVTKLETEVFDG